MRVRTSSLLLGIFAYTHCFASNTPSDNKRSVNLALETVLEFSDKDKASDIKFLDNVQNFITKVKTVIDKNSNVKTDFRRDFKTPTFDTITDFIQEAVKILNTYSNTTFKDFFDILDEEIRKYHYRGCKFYELMQNYEIRKMIAAKLDLLKSQSAAIIKANINTLSETLANVNHDKNITEVVDYINSLYRQDAREQLQKVLSDLHAHGKAKSNTNLREIIKNAVRSIVFDHYSNLNTNVRRDVKQKIEHFWKRFTHSADTSDNILNEAKKTKPVSRKHIANIDVKPSDYKKIGMKRNNMRLDKKRYKHNRDGPLKGQEKIKKLLSPQYTGPAVRQKTKTKHKEESSNSESLEFYQEPKDNTQQNKAIQSKKISQRTLMKSRKKSVKFLNSTTRLPADNTMPNIWIEESTGRLPKAVLDKLANQPRGHSTTTTGTNKHGPKHNNKNGKGQKSWHGKIYEPKHDKMSGKEYNKKNQDEHIRQRRTKYKSQSTHSARHTSREDTKHKPNKNSNIFNIELHQHKKNMGPFKEELNHADRSNAAATKTQKFLDVLDVPIPAKSGKTIKLPQRARTAANKKLTAPSRTQRVKYDEARRMKSLKMKHSKKNQMLSRKFQSLSSNEGTNVEQLVIKHGEKPEHQSQQTVNSLEKDLFVIKKIRNLERELQEVKSRLNGKTKVKHSAPKKTQKIRYLYETKTRSGANRSIKDSKLRQKKVDTSETTDNKTVVKIIENVQQITSKSNDIKDNTENGKSRINVNADETKVTKFPQSSEPSKLKHKISKMIPPRKSVVISKPIPGQKQITETDDDITKIMSENTYFQGVFPKYQKLMNELETDKANGMISGKTINDFSKVRDELLQMIETFSNNKTFLKEFIKNKDLKNLDKGVLSKNIFKSDINMKSNNFKDRKENTKLAMRTTNQTNAYNMANYKNRDLGINIEDIKNTLKGEYLTKAMKEKILYYEKLQNESLQMTKTANVTNNTLNKPIKENNFKSIDKNINSNTTNVTKNISNKSIIEKDFKNTNKDINSNTTNVTKNNLNEPIKEKDFKSINKTINSKTTNVTKNISNEPVKEKDFKRTNKDIINSKTINDTNTILNKLIKGEDLGSLNKYINSKTVFRSHSDIISNDLRSETEKPNIIRLANNKGDKDSKNNKVKDNVKEVKNKINVNADVVKEAQTTKFPHRKDPNNGKINFAKTRIMHPHVNKFIVDPDEKLLKSVDKNIIASFQKEYFEKMASKYHTLIADLETDKSKGIVKGSKLKHVLKDKLQHLETVPEDLQTKKAYDEFKAITNRLLNMSTNNFSQAKKSKTKEKHTRGLEPETSFSSRVNQNPNELQDTTEKTKVTEAVTDRTDSNEKNKKNGSKVGNEHQTNAVNKQRENIIEDTKSEGSSNIDDVTFIHRAGLEAMEDTGTKDNITSTSILTEATDTTSKATMTVVVTTPITLE